MDDQLAILPRPKWLTAASGATKAAWRILRGVVPVFLSRELISHEKQKAEVDFVRHLMKTEAEAIAEVRAKLWRSFGTAEAGARLSIRRQLEQLDEDIRHLAISGKALDYIPAKTSTSDIPLDAIPEHWMDRFLRLSRAANEPWRSELLARALASRACGQDVTPKLLWTIGTLDRQVFEAASYILDCSCIVAVEPGTETPLIPAFADALMDEVAIDYPENRGSRPYKFGSLIFILQESGLIGEVFANSIDLHKPTFTFRYGSEAYKVTKRDGKTPINLPGLMVTDLGRGLARFHSHTERIPGRQFFERALKLFSQKPFRKNRIHPKA